MLKVAVLYANDGIEVGYGEGSELAAAVHHDVPHKEGEDDTAVAGEETDKVEVGSVIERCHDADIMQRGGITLVVLYGIDEGVYDVGVAKHEGGVVVGSLQKVVVIGIDAGYHVATHTVTHEGKKSGLLALGETGTGREHHFEVACIVFELAEYHAPEEYVVVAFDVGYDTAALTFSAQRVGGGEIVGGDMML